MNNPVLANSSLEGFEVNMNNVSSDKKLKKELVDKYDKFIDSLEVNLSSLKDTDDLLIKRKFLWEQLMKTYDNNTSTYKTNQKKVLEKKAEYNILKSKMEEKYGSLKNFRDNITTKKQNTNNLVSKINLTLYQLKYLKHVLIGLIILSVIPLLYITKVLEKNIAIILMSIFVVISMLYCFYFLFYNLIGRDPSNLDKIKTVNVEEPELDKLAENADILENNFNPYSVKIPDEVMNEYKN